MPGQHSATGKNIEGFTLVEVLIALAISAVILTAVVSLFTTSAKTFQKVKDVSDVNATAKDAMARLEWLFQRWGVSTPCDSANTPLCTSVAQDCQVNGVYPYPPPSSVCMTILDNDPDEAIFYANLYGNGFVHVPELSNLKTMNIKSCRLLAGKKTDNCYYLKMGAKFIVDQQNTAIYTPLIFSLSSLSADNLNCTDGTIAANATVSSRTTARNGFLDSGGTTDTYTLEGGEVILRVPHRVRLYCRSNPGDKNNRWLYMDVTDMASHCNANEPAQPLIPVNSFNIIKHGEGIVVTMQVRATNGKVMDVQRYFGR